MIPTPETVCNAVYGACAPTPGPNILTPMSADLRRLQDHFRATYGRPPHVVAEAPGRVNLIGEHTDYNGGFVLPIAIDRTVAVAAAPRDGRLIRVRSLDLGQEDQFEPDCVAPLPDQPWSNYIRGVAWALREEGGRLGGSDLAVTGDVPQGAGLSSSAALAVSATAALACLSDREIDRRHLALLAQKAENRFVGVQCGIMDQFAAALAQPGCALLIDCRSMETQHVPLPPHIAIAVVDSKMPRRLGETEYNQRREECVRAAALLGLPSLRDADIARLEQARERMPDVLYRRARHVITENQRVLRAVDALRDHDLHTLGTLLLQSHESLRDDYQVSCPALDLLVDLAARVPGVYGARLTGAGFGGCTVNVMAPGALALFQQLVPAEYARQAGLACQIYACQAQEGLRITYV